MAEDKRQPIVERRTVALTQDVEELLNDVINKEHKYDDYSSAIRGAVRIAFGQKSCVEHKAPTVAG